jgi:hypothetical protein
VCLRELDTYLRQSYVSRELQLRSLFTFCLKYGANGQSFPGAGYEHFRSDVVIGASFVSFIFVIFGCAIVV